MQDKDIEDLRAAIAALEGQRATLGDSVLDMATAPLRTRLASLLRPAGLQRRQVTVVFADVVGSTALAQGMDAEDTLALLSEALRHMADIVHAHQGRVLRFTGDGVKAAFGMDEAREDDAERAVRAGLAILSTGREQADIARRRHGVTDFSVRVGVHTGDVALGAGVEADNTAMGAAVNIAARMEQTAPPGALRISHDTWSQVRGLFDLQPQPPLQVKGVDAPMQTYLVHAALERSVASVERGLQGLRTPMVGRDAELQGLLETVARARETRQLQALTLLGNAGLGKSRLLRELTVRLIDCRVLTLRSQPDGLLRPWGLLRSLLATQFGVADTDSADAARRKVVEGLSPWFEERGERQAHLIGQLSGLDFGDSPNLRGLDPRTLRDQAFVALRAYLKALAAPGRALPVLIVEDLHWADEGSLDLVQHLLAHSAELPLALLMTSRPALLARRPDWGTPGTTLQLSPLAAAHSDELAQALLQRLDAVPQQLNDLIVDRAEGNPYYMEELVRRLIDDGVIDTGTDAGSSTASSTAGTTADDTASNTGAERPRWTVRTDRLDTVRLPTTLVGLLQARLDALPAGERAAARQASVIGHVFWDEALQALDANAPQALPALQRAAFVKAHDTSDFDGTPERQFDHHLLHQVTYDTLLKAERRLGHGAAARWLAERTKGRGSQFLAMTGEHAERAGEIALAIDCFEQAGKEAQKRFANAAAASWLRRSLVLLGESDPGRRFRLLNELELIAATLGDRSTQDVVHADMTTLLERHPDDASQARLWHLQALLAERRSDRVSSEEHALRACGLAERCGAARTAALSHCQLAWLQFVRHEMTAAVAHIEPGLRWAAQIEADSDRAQTEGVLLTMSAMVSLRLSDYSLARRTLLEVLARGESMGSAPMKLRALDNLAVIDGVQAHWDDLRQRGEQMLAAAQESGSVTDMVKAQWHLSVSAKGRGDSAAELHWAESILPLARASAFLNMEAVSLLSLARLRHDANGASAALPLFQQAQAVCRAAGDALHVWECASYIAICEAELGHFDAARSTVDATLDAVAVELKNPATETLPLRWNCQRVLQTLGDSRAGSLLEQLHADIQADAVRLAEPSDRERLFRERRLFADILSAYQQMRGTSAAGG